jgi:hypothetical protein
MTGWELALKTGDSLQTGMDEIDGQCRIKPTAPDDKDGPRKPTSRDERDGHWTKQDKANSSG